MAAESIHQRATKYTEKLETGLPSKVNETQDKLREEFRNLTASDYSKLLGDIRNQNMNHREENSHLPQIEFYDSSNSGAPNHKDGVKLNYGVPNVKEASKAIIDEANSRVFGGTGKGN